MVKRRKCWFIPKKKPNKLAIAQTLHASFIDIYKFQKSNNPCVVDFFLGNIIMGLGCDIQDNIL